MEDPTPLGCNAPRDLWVAKPIRGREGRKAERADFDRLPWLDHASSEPACFKLGFGPLDQCNLGFAAEAPFRPQDNGRWSEGAAKGIDVRMIAVQMGEQTRGCRRGLGRRGYLRGWRIVAVEP
jgi:hypothetical protein